jgi:hypothetical protein
MYRVYAVTLTRSFVAFIRMNRRAFCAWSGSFLSPGHRSHKAKSRSSVFQRKPITFHSHRSHTKPFSEMKNQRIAFLLIWASLLVAPSASFCVSRLTAGRSADASSSSRAKPTLFAVNVGSRMYYRNDKEAQNLPFVSNSVAISRSRTEPKVLLDPRELPKHSPSPETLKEQKVLMDMEMLIGRFFMVAALMFFAGEIASGLSITDQLAGIF